MKKVVFLIIFSCVSLASMAQGVFKGNYWKQYRKEITGGIGPSNFLGELGGKNQIGTDFAQDLEMKATKFCLNFGYRYYLRSDMAIKLGAYYGIVSGDDKLTQEPFRNNRNIHFRSPIVETSLMFEYHILKEKAGAGYKIKGAKGMGRSKFGLYGFGGIGFFYFNPQAKYTDGSWHNLQPLGTEGQGIGTNVSRYNQIGLCLPYGIGVRYLLRSKWRLGLEAGVRKTFSDYIDDVSTNYYDPAAITEAYGPIAGYFSNPATSKDFNEDTILETSPGLQRGDPKDKDTYIFVCVNLSYKIVKQRSFRRIRSRRSVPSF